MLLWVQPSPGQVKYCCSWLLLFNSSLLPALQSLSHLLSNPDSQPSFPSLSHSSLQFLFSSFYPVSFLSFSPTLFPSISPIFFRSFSPIPIPFLLSNVFSCTSLQPYSQSSLLPLFIIQSLQSLSHPSLQFLCPSFYLFHSFLPILSHPSLQSLFTTFFPIPFTFFSPIPIPALLFSPFSCPSFQPYSLPSLQSLSDPSIQSLFPSFQSLSHPSLQSLFYLLSHPFHIRLSNPIPYLPPIPFTSFSLIPIPLLLSNPF